MDRKEAISRYHATHIDELCWATEEGPSNDDFVELSDKGVYVARGKAFVYNNKGILVTAYENSALNFFEDKGKKIGEGACTLITLDGKLRVLETRFGNRAELLETGENYPVDAIFHSGSKWWNALEQMFTRNGRPRFAQLGVEVVENCYRDFEGVRFYDVDAGKKALRQYFDDLSEGVVPELKQVVETTIVNILPVDGTVN